MKQLIILTLMLSGITVLCQKEALLRDVFIMPKEAIEAYDPADFQTYLKTFEANMQNKTTPDTVFVVIHVITNSSGTGQGARDIELLQEIDSANTYFNNAQLHLSVCTDINIISDDFYYELDISAELDLLKENFYVPGAINVFYVNSILWNSIYVGGFGTGVWGYNAMVIMNYSSVGGTTITHEIAHVFHLNHTHGKYAFDSDNCDGSLWDDPYISDAVECMGASIYDTNTSLDINGDGICDCLQTGDDICDTHAEPNLYDGALLDGCNYIGTILDPNGDSYDPIVGNVMSYGPCKDFMTTEQYAKIRYTWERYGQVLSCSPCIENNSFTVIDTTNTGIGSLRWAISCANGKDSAEVNFNIPGVGPHVFNSLWELPGVYDNVKINGESQPSDGLVLNGALLPNEYDVGINVYGNNVEINGFTFINYAYRAIINYYGYDDLKIINNNFYDLPYDGIDLWECDNLLIQGNRFTVDNLGIYMNDCSNVFIKGNRFENNGSIGLYIKNSRFVTIGDTIDNLYNVFTGNYYYGIGIYEGSYDVDIFNNYIGTDEFSATDKGNGYFGINLSESHDIRIGNANVGNVIGMNGYYAIEVSDTSYSVSIQNNCIGTDLSGNTELPNLYYGINVQSFSQAIVGGDSEELENVIAYHPYYSLSIEDTAKCLIMRNKIYCNGYGISIEEGSNNDIQPPIINDITDAYTIEGEALNGTQVDVYMSDPDCTHCEGRYFLGNSIAVGGTWSISLSSPLNIGDKISAIASFDDVSSEHSDCIISEVAGVEQLIEESSLSKIFPNPTKGKIEIIAEDIYSVKLIDVRGNLVLKKESKTSISDLDISPLTNGSYILNLMDKNNLIISSHKIVKE